MVLWSFAPCAYELELAIRLTPLPIRPSSPVSSVDPGTSSFSSLLLHARPTTARCVNRCLLTLVWQMLSPTVNVTSLGAMIHGPVGISRYGALQKRPAGLLYLRLNFMCSSAQGTLPRFVSALPARAHSSRCEILQLEVRLHRSYRALADDARSYGHVVNPIKNSMYCVTHARRPSFHRRVSLSHPRSSMPWFITVKLTSGPDEASVVNTTQVCASLSSEYYYRGFL